MQLKGSSSSYERTSVVTNSDLSHREFEVAKSGGQILGEYHSLSGSRAKPVVYWNQYFSSLFAMGIAVRGSIHDPPHSQREVCAT